MAIKRFWFGSALERAPAFQFGSLRRDSLPICQAREQALRLLSRRLVLAQRQDIPTPAVYGRQEGDLAVTWFMVRDGTVTF